MNRYFFQKRIVLLALNPRGGVFPVFGSDVPRHPCNARRFLLGTFQNNLNSIAFLSHRCICLFKRECKDSAFQVVGKMFLKKTNPITDY
jgi:hypothetical protein